MLEKLWGLDFSNRLFERGPVAPNWRASCFVATEKPAPGELNLASVGGQYADLQRILGMTVMHALAVNIGKVPVRVLTFSVR